jgi:hypothetical protein
MDKNIVVKTVSIIVIAVIVFFIYITSFWGPSYSISAEKLDEEPDSYINISEFQMQQFPYLKEAILNNHKYIDISTEELYEIEDFLGDKGTINIKYLNQYYEISIWYGEG